MLVVVLLLVTLISCTMVYISSGWIHRIIYSSVGSLITIIMTTKFQNLSELENLSIVISVLSSYATYIFMVDYLSVVVPLVSTFLLLLGGLILSRNHVSPLIFFFAPFYCCLHSTHLTIQRFIFLSLSCIMYTFKGVISIANENHA